ncbi:4338_t:CDS:2, partial [Gigaspora rosea]
EFSNEKLIPVLNDIKNSQWIYSRYFCTFPFNKWSLEHYKKWILRNYPRSKKEVYDRSFLKIIRKIKHDSKTLEEIREFLSKLEATKRIGSHCPAENENEHDGYNVYAGYNAMLKGDASIFIEMISEYHRSKSLRELRGYNEGSFQTAVELLLPKNGWLSEVRLMADSTKRSGEGRLNFADVFVNGVNKRGRASSVLLELKHITMVGLLSGATGKWVNNPSYESLEDLEAKLENETEAEILDRTYFYWCKGEEKCKRVKVGKIISDGVNQLKRYLSIMQKGNINSRKTSGVCDNRIKIEKAEGLLR